MNRALEAISRHIFKILIIVILIPLLSLAVAYFMVPRTYQAQVSLWALHRYAVIGATGSESNLLDTPANTQATALQELLQTRSFALKVAHSVNLAPTLHLSASVLANSTQLDDALFAELSRNVIVTAGGYNLYVVSYANRDPQIALQIVGQVINQFSIQSYQFAVDEAQTLVSSYQDLLQKAQDSEKQAEQAEAHYLTTHPGLNAQNEANDPQYQSLHAATQQAQANVQSIQGKIGDIQQQITAQGPGANNLFTQVDAPHTLFQPVSRTKTFLTVGIVALVIALVACIIYLLIVLRNDHSFHTPLELQKVSDLPVLMQLPRLPSPAVAFMVRSLSLDDD